MTSSPPKEVSPLFERLRDFNFCLKNGYRSRNGSPANSALQREAPPDIYPWAAFLAKKFSCGNILDLGCGSAEEAVAGVSGVTLTGVGSGENLQRFRTRYPEARFFDLAIAEQYARIPDRELVRRSVVVCANLLERVSDPVALLATLAELLADAPIAIVTSPDRERLQSAGDDGPPKESTHLREWSRQELEQLFRSLGLMVDFAGHTPADTENRSRDTAVLLLRRSGSELQLSAAPANFRVKAFICAYNEEDIIEATLRYLTAQGVDVHLVDNWSTDCTVERAKAFLGRGLSKITKFPVDGPSLTYDWHNLLRHVEELSFAGDADWYIHYDADEIRESPWPQLSLREALYRVDREGFNAIDHTCLVFHPTEDGGENAEDPESFRWFDFGRRGGHFVQIKGWKRQPVRINLAESGGHAAEFPGRKVYPFKFLLRHYPVRSQAHGIQKILADRRPRWNPEERQSRGWHIQYDHIQEEHNFLMQSSSLLRFSPDHFYSDYLIERLSGVGIPRI